MLFRKFISQFVAPGKMTLDIALPNHQRDRCFGRKAGTGFSKKGAPEQDAPFCNKNRFIMMAL
jgi:hypothetical protein